MLVKGRRLEHGDVGRDVREVVAGGLMLAHLVLEQLGLNLEVGQLLAQALGLDAQLLALLLANLDLLLHHDAAFDGNVILRFEVFERGGGVAGLPFKVVVGHLGVAQLELQGAVGVPEGRYFLLEYVLGAGGLALGLLVLALLRY